MFFERVIFNVMLVFGIVALVMFVAHRAFMGRTRIRDEFIKEEQAANSARTRAVEAHFYFRPDLAVLPLQDAPSTPELARKQQEIIDLSAKTMLNFGKKLSNIELKMLYGPASLEKIIQQEGFFEKYIHALVAWGDALIETGQESDGVPVLEESLRLNSEHRKTYLRLADYYAAQENHPALDNLIEKITANFSNEIIKKQLINYVMDKRGI